MENLATRKNLVVTQGSDAAEYLVDKILGSAADFLAGETFATSELANVEREQTFYFEDEQVVCLSFCARRIGKREDELPGSHVSFNVTLVNSKPWHEPNYWPEEDEDEEGEQVKEPVGLIIDDEIDEDADEDEMRRMQEVTEYYIDDEDYTPRKLISHSFYDEDGDPVMMLSTIDHMASRRMLDEDPDIDVDLQVKEACLSTSFSEFEVIEICRSLGRLGIPVESVT